MQLQMLKHSEKFRPSSQALSVAFLLKPSLAEGRLCRNHRQKEKLQDGFTQGVWADAFGKNKLASQEL